MTDIRTLHIGFIGGGNMATAILSGLLRQGLPAAQIDIVEPVAEARQRLKSQFGVVVHERATPALHRDEVLVWAVKPQQFQEAAHPVRGFCRHALHVSVAAGIPSDSIAHWLGSERIVRSMPNTPALIGKGISGLYARPAVSAADRQTVQAIMTSVGDFLWLDAEEQLDAVTALSGSGPAYMFYFMEAMTDAGMLMGLTREQAYALTVATFVGAGELARASDDPPEILRQRVTSKGGTTYAAITSMEDSAVKELFIRALVAAQTRARELAREFGQTGT